MFCGWESGARRLTRVLLMDLWAAIKTAQLSKRSNASEEEMEWSSCLVTYLAFANETRRFSKLRWKIGRCLADEAVATWCAFLLTSDESRPPRRSKIANAQPRHAPSTSLHLQNLSSTSNFEEVGIRSFTIFASRLHLLPFHIAHFSLLFYVLFLSRQQ